MSSIQGTFSGYEGISSYRSYLDLSMDDKEFVTNIPNPLLFSENSVDRNDFDKKTIDIPSYGGYSKSSIGNPSNYTIISLTPSLSLFKNFISYYNLEKYVYSHSCCTIFVPIDNNMKEMFALEQKSLLTPKDIINFHILDFILTPVQLYNRKLRLEPMLRGQTFLTDNTSIITETSDKNPNNILKSIKTSSGYIYLIERPLIPYIY